MNPVMDIPVHFSWSTCALRMKFWSYFTIIQRPAEHLEELEIWHTEERIFKGEAYDSCLQCFKVLPGGKM